MSRINTNVSSIIAQRILSKQNSRMNLALERLSTGLRINTGKDDPAGLIASETMRAEQRAIQAAQTNVARATNVVSVAESGLSEVSRLLTDLEDLVDRTANETGISEEEKEANQQEIDLILQSINRIANSTELQGRKLLAGDLNYTTSSYSPGTDIDHLQLNSVRVPEGGKREIAYDLIDSAETAYIGYTGGDIGATPVTIELTGELGTERLTFQCAAVADVITAIQGVKQLTGVSAVASGGDASINSTEYGSDQFISVRVLSGAFATTATSDNGEDIQVNINGESVTGKGLKASVRTATLDADLTFTTTWNSGGAADKFGVTGGGADFAIAPKLDLNGTASLGISSLTTSSLGKNGEELYKIGSGQTYSMNGGDFYTAQRIVRESISQVANLRGRLGSFQKNILDTTANSLQIQYENVTAAESTLRDADFAQETSNLTRAQILVQSATNVLRLANQAPQNVLALIG